MLRTIIQSLSSFNSFQLGFRPTFCQVRALRATRFNSFQLGFRREARQNKKGEGKSFNSFQLGFRPKAIQVQQFLCPVSIPFSQALDVKILKIDQRCGKLVSIPFSQALDSHHPLSSFVATSCFNSFQLGFRPRLLLAYCR